MLRTVQQRRFIRKVSRLGALVACIGFGFAGIVGSGESFRDISIGSDEVSIVGTLTGSGGFLDGVTVRAMVLTSPATDSQESMTTSNTSGVYSIDVAENTDIYFEFSEAGFATLNTQFNTFADDTSGIDADLLLTNEANDVLDAAFMGMMFTLPDRAWLIVDVENAAGDEVDGATITTAPVAVGGGALNCDGTLTGGDITTAIPACNPARSGPMYLVYFDADVEVTITVGTQALVAPVRVGEFTDIRVVQ